MVVSRIRSEQPRDVQRMHGENREENSTSWCLCSIGWQFIITAYIYISFILPSKKDFHTEKWYHPDCLTTIHKSLKESTVEQIRSEVLENSDREILGKMLNRLQQRKTSAKRGSILPTQIQIESTKSTKVSKEEEGSPLKGRLKRSIDDDEDWQAKPKETPNAESSDSESETEKPKGYSEGEWTRFKKIRNECQSRTAAALKQLLRLNDQAMGGTKIDLVERIADAKTLGCIPKCSSCGGGRLRFNPKAGKYRCPGYMEDTDFIHCNKVFNKEDIKRTEWIEE